MAVLAKSPMIDGFILGEKHPNIADLLPNLTEIPQRYLWAPNMKDNMTQDTKVDDDGADLALPIVHFSDLVSEDPAVKMKTVQQIGLACEQWGFLQVINHGISEDFYQNAVTQCRKFFELPTETKEKATYGPDALYSGYTGRWPAYDTSAPWLETLADSVAATENSSSVLNLSWPEGNPDLNKAIADLCNMKKEIGIKVLESLALHLGLEPSAYSRLFKKSEDHASSWRLNYYPKCPRPDLTIGAGPHADPNVLTLLRADCDGGLQVRKDNRWVDVPNIASSNALVVNVGDTLEVMSNGRYKSVEHRVVVLEDSDRISTVLGMTLLHTTTIESSPELVDDEHPSLFKPYTYKEYIENIRKIKRLNGKSAIKYVRRDNALTPAGVA